MMPRNPRSPVFELEEKLPLWGWWFEITQFGKYTIRLDNTGKTKGLNQRIPAIGEKVEVKGVEMVVAYLDLEGCVLAVIPPSPEEHRDGAKLSPVHVVDHNGEPARFPVDLPRGYDDIRADVAEQVLEMLRTGKRDS